MYYVKKYDPKNIKNKENWAYAKRGEILIKFDLNMRFFRLRKKFMFSIASVAGKLCCFGNFTIDFTHGRSSRES